MNQLWLAIRVGRLFVLAVAIVCVGMASTVLAQNADLSVVKSGPSVIVADNDAEYTVSVTNFSGEMSTPTNTLTDTFPAELTFVSAVLPDGWTCTTPPVAGPNSITCTSTDAIPDESAAVFTFTFHVAPGLSLGTQVTNSASISHQGSDPNSINDNSMFTSVVGTPPPPPLTVGEVLISEFRLSGPDGSEDDFIELYCNRDTPCDISGTSLRGYDPVKVGDYSMTFPPQSIIPARQYYLVGDSRGYSLESYGGPDIDVALSQPPPSDPPEPGFYFYDNEGFQLIGAEEPTVIDSVGFAGGGNDSQYVEGTGLQRASSRPADQYAYVRKRTMETNGLPQDSNNNAADFVLVSVTGTAHPGIIAPPVLGAPGPQGLSSPLTYSNSQIPGTLVDPTKNKDEDPNRVRVGSGDSGTLSIRRSFTNNTGGTLDYLGFRVIEISTLNSPITLDDQAQLRLISSSETAAEVPSRGGAVTIFGTTLEYDEVCACLKPQQPNGGGLNSTVSTSFSEEGIFQPNSTVDVQFLMNVVKSGSYRIFVYVEAGNSRAFLVPEAPTATKATSTRTTPRRFASMRRLPSASAIKSTQQTPVITTMTAPTPGRLTTPVSSRPTPATVRNAPAPRVIFINRGIAEDEKKPRKKKRVRRKNSAALQKKAEEKFAAEKPQN